jgi:hypothetical protein
VKQGPPSTSSHACRHMMEHNGTIAGMGPSEERGDLPRPSTSSHACRHLKVQQQVKGEAQGKAWGMAQGKAGLIQHIHTRLQARNKGWRVTLSEERGDLPWLRTTSHACRHMLMKKGARGLAAKARPSCTSSHACMHSR